MPMPDLNLSDIQFDGTSIDASYLSDFGTDLYSKDYLKNFGIHILFQTNPNRFNEQKQIIEKSNQTQRQILN